MRESLKLVCVGVISGLIVLFASWYFSDVRNNVRASIKIEHLESELGRLRVELFSLRSELSQLSTKFARIDERTKVTTYNKQLFEDLSKSKNIPLSKVNSAQKFLGSMPSVKKAVNYLETNLGFSPPEASAVVKKQYQDDLFKQKPYPNRWQKGSESYRAPELKLAP